MEAELAALDRYFERRFKEVEEKTELARREVDRRMEGMNELRAQIEQERGQYMTRELYDQRHEALVGRVGRLDNRLATLEGGTQIRAATVGWLIAGLGLILTVVIVVVNVLTGNI